VISVIENEMGGACRMHGGKRGACRVLVGRLEGKRQLGRPRHRRGIILKWIFQGGDGFIYWIDVV